MRLIDADAFIEENKDIIDCEIDHPKYQDTLRDLINNAPTVEARQHGEWIYDWGDIVCSKCSAIVYQGVPRDRLKGSLWNYCPNCGARMKEGEEK